MSTRTRGCSRFRDTRTGTLQGYEIDLLRKLALAIFGSEDAIEFKTVHHGASG